MAKKVDHESDPPPPLSRFAAALAVLATAALITACGGGGGTPAPADPPAPPPPVVVPPTAAVVISTMSPADGATDIAPNVAITGTFTATNAGTVNGNATVSCPGSIGVAVAVAGNSFTATPAGNLPEGASCTATVNLSGSLGGSATKTVAFTVAAKKVYKFGRLNLVVFADQSAYIGKIDGKVVTPLVNKTGYTDGIEPLRLCGLYDVLLEDGRVLASCVTRHVGNIRRNFPINPLTGEMMEEYTGVVPAGAVLRDVGYGTFGDTPYAAFGVSRKGMYLNVPSVGTYYFTATDAVNLRLTTDGFATSEIIHVGDHKFLATYSNP